MPFRFDKGSLDLKRQLISLITDAARPAEIFQHFLHWFQIISAVIRFHYDQIKKHFLFKGNVKVMVENNLQNDFETGLYLFYLLSPQVG